LVTGGSRGIGATIARRLVNEGARVIVNFHTSRHEAEQVVADIAAHGCWAEAAQADVADMRHLIEKLSPGHVIRVHACAASQCPRRNAGVRYDHYR
jgi:NAD(P)-dependent dehydrogenase (short-subunit alcohol dehydrogenase family)